MLRHPPPHPQRGIALVIALIFLLLMTMIGVSAIQGTTMQERMAGNMQDRNTAFQGAEAALRAGEAWLDTPGNTGIQNRAAAQAHNALADLANNWYTSPEPSTGQPGTMAGLAAAPLFNVSRPFFIRPWEAMDLSQPECERIYPVTTHSVGSTAAAAVSLRSFYDPRLSGRVTCPNLFN